MMIIFVTVQGVPATYISHVEPSVTGMKMFEKICLIYLKLTFDSLILNPQLFDSLISLYL